MVLMWWIWSGKHVISVIFFISDNKIVLAIGEPDNLSYVWRSVSKNFRKEEIFHNKIVVKISTNDPHKMLITKVTIKFVN